MNFHSPSSRLPPDRNDQRVLDDVNLPLQENGRCSGRLFSAALFASTGEGLSVTAITF
jgi:hypothetical protein